MDRMTCGESESLTSEQISRKDSTEKTTEEMPLNTDVPPKKGSCVCGYAHVCYEIHSKVRQTEVRMCHTVSLLPRSLSEKSFRQCLLSWFFLRHLLWLSVMQLRHYLFIGTLNPMLQHLTNGEPSLGKHARKTD